MLSIILLSKLCFEFLSHTSVRLSISLIMEQNTNFLNLFLPYVTFMGVRNGTCGRNGLNDLLLKEAIKKAIPKGRYNVETIFLGSEETFFNVPRKVVYLANNFQNNV